MNIYDELNVDRIINASDTYTRIGGSRMSRRTLETMQEAATDHSAEGDACANAEAVADPFERWDDFAALYHLTPRESEVLLLFARGRSYERIQETLVIARGTVNYHMSNAYRKIGISSRQDLLDRLDEAACSNERK